MEKKDFDGWIKVKEKLHFGASQPYIKEGDIWWCSFGENVGVEINKEVIADFFRVKIFPTLASWAAGIPECVFIILYFDVKINYQLV